ncbi:hypothetical protein GCM10018773_30570 [Streptomyces candidus]|nr:hypothetical protein GCM10018773_30570 [Streptomyces candidus]
MPSARSSSILARFLAARRRARSARVADGAEGTDEVRVRGAVGGCQVGALGHIEAEGAVRTFRLDTSKWFDLAL